MALHIGHNLHKHIHVLVFSCGNAAGAYGLQHLDNLLIFTYYYFLRPFVDPKELLE
jgi:hypothetical protein